jgi:hypothetical protein
MSGQGAAIGAAVGATYGLATGKDPLKYAMIGGAVGGAGPGALAAMGGTGAAAAGTGAAAAGTGAGTAGAAGTTGALTGAGASTAANTAFMAPAGVNAGAVMGASQAAPTLTTTTPGIFAPPAGGYQSLTAGMQQPLTYEQATATGMQRPYGTFESLLNPNIESSSMAPTFMEQLGSGAGQVGQFAQQNPALNQMAVQSAQQMMQQPQRRSQPPGLLRGNQMQVAAPQYQVGVPQVSLI